MTTYMNMSMKDLGFEKYDFRIVNNTGSGNSGSKNTETSSEKLRKKVAAVEKDYEQQQKSLNTNGDKAVKGIMNIYNSSKNQYIDQIASKIETLMASNLPGAAEKAMVKVFTDKIQDTLLVEPSSYKNCKTAPQLVKKVAEQIGNKKGKFTFTSDKITYTVNFKSIGSSAAYVTGTITAGNGRTYNFGGTSVNKASVNTELSYLKQFADSKIEEAKKAAYTDAAGILIPSELKTFIKTTTKSKVFNVLKKKSSNIEKYVKAASEMTEKFIAVKNAYNSLKSINLDNADEEKVTKTILDYNKKVKAYEKAVDSFLDIKL